MNIQDIAKEGLNKLNSGSLGISLSALNKDDLHYLLDFYNSEGFDAKEEKPISKEGVGTIYPLIVFHEIPVGVNQNA